MISFRMGKTNFTNPLIWEFDVATILLIFILNYERIDGVNHFPKITRKHQWAVAGIVVHRNMWKISHRWLSMTRHRLNNVNVWCICNQSNTFTHMHIHFRRCSRCKPMRDVFQLAMNFEFLTTIKKKNRNIQDTSSKGHQT